MAATPPLAQEDLVSLISEIDEYAIFLLAPDGEIRSWNPGAARIFGYDAGEIVGRNFSTFYADQDLAAKKPETELEIAARDGRVEDEGWRTRKDGSRFWANTVITALHADDGSVRGFSKITRDLTERVAAEEKLRRSEETLRLLVQSVKDYAIFMLDPEGNVATWNTGAQRFKGWKPEEIIGRHFSAFYPAEDIASGKPKRELELAKRYGSVEDEGWRIRKDGTRFWGNVVITAIYGPQGDLRGFAKVTRDLTDRRTADEARRALLEQREARVRAEEEKRSAEAASLAAQEANRAKDAFLMTLSHQLRTPMTAILGWARLLPTLDHGDEGFQSAVEAISHSAEMQAQLIDDLLDVSRILAGKLQLKVESSDLASIIRAAADTVRTAAAGKSIALEFDLPPNLGRAEVDRTRIHQVIWNLLSNAVKFTPPGGSITVTAERLPTTARIAIKDTGEGIDAAFLRHLFEPFRQAEGPVTRQHGGLGLGLSIARYLVESHGGTLTASSEGIGKGATFVLELPIGSATDADQTQARHVYRIPRRLVGIDAIVVEDDPAGRDFLKAALVQAGASVRAVGSVAEARRLAAEKRPDLVITDIGLPGEDGYSLVRSLRADPATADVKIAVVTAFAGERERSAGLELDRFFIKPVDPFRLVEELGTMFDAGS
ncbi:MAG: PAS domain-containing hybrid sensor histidine kinase/response regulator [Thermoanaerobaculia bacterium]